MATFERGTSLMGEAQQYQKYPLKRLEPAIQKFMKVIQIDLARLHRHKLNIERHHDTHSLHTEHINATRTVQQIKANITEIEKSRLQVKESDLPAFDKQIASIKEKALQSVREFVNLTSSGNKKNTDVEARSDSSPNGDLSPSDLALPGQGHVGEDQALLMEDVPDNSEVIESWENLQENLEELNCMIHDFSSLVNDQQEKIDNIENNIESAHSEVKLGTKYLGKALGYKAAMFPAAGALLGTVVAGPVGFVAGAKFGSIIGALGGGTFGYISGKFLKKRMNKVTEIELSKLTRSNSSPVIHQDVKEGESSCRGRKRHESWTVISSD